MAARSRTVRVYEVAYDGVSSLAVMTGVGLWAAEATGTSVYRTRSQADADDFARGRTHHGQPAQVWSTDVPRAVAQRWGMR